MQGWFWPEEVASTLLSDLCLKVGHKFVFEKFSFPPIPHPTEEEEKLPLSQEI